MSDTLRNNVTNWVAMQLGWLACVMGGNGWAYVALVLLIALHMQIAKKGEWCLVLAAAAYGIAQDTVLYNLGGLSFLRDDACGVLIAPWLMCLWVMFCTQFKHCMTTIMNHPWMAVCFGLIAPISYFGGVKAGVIALQPWAYVYLALGWALFLGVLSWRAFKPASKVHS